MGFWRFGPRRAAEFFRLPAERRRMLMSALRLLWFVRVGLWAMSFRRLRHVLKRMERTAGDAGPSASLDELLWCIESTARYVPAATCLTRSLAAQVLLRRHGLPSTLRIGVARGHRGTIEAHAWVECDGRVVIGELSDLSRFTALPPLEAVAH